MKNRLILPMLIFGIVLTAEAQHRQTDTTSYYRTIIPVEKQSLMKNVDLIFNTQLAFRADFRDGDFQGAKYKFEQLRLEFKGYVHEKIYFRFRHRYTSTFEPQSIDKIIKGVDFAYFRFDLGKKWQLTLGKTFADWGGIEFDLNPIDIYEYSDIIEMADNFLTGAGFFYKATKNHGLSFQLLDSRTSTFEDLYDTVPDVKASKIPLAIVFNWRGNFFNGKFSTLWSYSLFTEAQGIGKNYIALGNLFQSGKWYVAYDYKISMEGLDRTGIISDEIPDNLYNYAVKNTRYQSHWTRITYKMTPKWHLSLDAFVDFADWNDDLDPLKTQKRFRTVYSYIPTLEFYPWENLNFKFFIGFVNRFYRYSDYAKNRPGLELKDYSTFRGMIGLITPLHVL